MTGIRIELIGEVAFETFLELEVGYRCDVPTDKLGIPFLPLIEILKREMDAANQRKQYRHIIRYLSDLSNYPGGQKAAKELAEYWHVYHRNRPAMKDELWQAGYPQK